MGVRADHLPFPTRVRDVVADYSERSLTSTPAADR
jgi:hypothetical protein